MCSKRPDKRKVESHQNNDEYCFYLFGSYYGLGIIHTERRRDQPFSTFNSKQPASLYLEKHPTNPSLWNANVDGQNPLSMVKWCKIDSKFHVRISVWWGFPEVFCRPWISPENRCVFRLRAEHRRPLQPPGPCRLAARDERLGSEPPRPTDRWH